MEPLTLILIIIVGIFIGIIGVTVGSSALISIPFLMTLGLNPYFAIATSKFAVLSSFITGVKYYKKGIMKHKKLALILSLAAFIGSIIGANLVLKINEYVLKVIIISLLIIVLLITIIKNKVGLEPKEKKFTKKSYFLSFITILFLGIYAGFFGAGFGSFTIFALIYFFSLTFLQSAALMRIINFFALIIAVIIFAYNNVIDYSIGVPLLISIAIGGWVGAHFAVLKGNVWIKRLFILVTSILIIKLILNF